MATELVRVFDGTEIAQRAGDGYLNATAMCKANGKQWTDYWRLDGTKEYVQTITESTGIPVDSLVETRSGRGGGTYVHPELAMHLAQWCSPKFAWQVSKWVWEILNQGHTSIRSDRSDRDECDDELDMLLSAVKRLKEVRTAQREAERKLAEVERTARQASLVANAAIQQGQNNHGYFTVLGYCRLTNREITEAEAQKVGKKASAILRKRGLTKGEQRSERYGKVGSYPESVLAEVFGDNLPVLA